MPGESIEAETAFDWKWKWDPEEDSQTARTGDFWIGNMSVTFDTDLNKWFATAGAAHIQGVTGHGEPGGTVVALSCLPAFGPGDFGVDTCVAGKSVAHGNHLDAYGFELTRVQGNPAQNRFRLFGSHTGAPVPEPSSALLLMPLLGTAGAFVIHRRSSTRA